MLVGEHHRANIVSRRTESRRRHVNDVQMPIHMLDFGSFQHFGCDVHTVDMPNPVLRQPQTGAARYRTLDQRQS
jgi:hypothetical protein